MNEFNKNLAEELAKQVPIKQIYEDGIKITIKETGETLGLVPRTIKAALAPLEKWILYKEYSIKETQKLLESKLENLQPEKIVTPEPYVAIPAFQAISYSMDNEELRNLYANLLANSMNIDTKDSVHPSYVEIIKQLSPDEVKILNTLYKNEEFSFPLIQLIIKQSNSRYSEYRMEYNHLSQFNFNDICNNLLNLPLYFDNLERLGIIRTSYELSFLDNNRYEGIKNHEEILTWKSKNTGEGIKEIKEGHGEITSLGRLFLRTCYDSNI